MQKTVSIYIPEEKIFHVYSRKVLDVERLFEYYPRDFARAVGSLFMNETMPDVKVDINERTAYFHSDMVTFLIDSNPQHRCHRIGSFTIRTNKVEDPPPKTEVHETTIKWLFYPPNTAGLLLGLGMSREQARSYMLETGFNVSEKITYALSNFDGVDGTVEKQTEIVDSYIQEGMEMLNQIVIDTNHRIGIYFLKD